jgi:Tol biopolymer transport system component
MATRSDPEEDFGAAERVASIDTDDGEGSPSISADGLTLYFTSNRPGGAGVNDLWVATRAAPTEEFSEVTRLAGVSSIWEERSPSISADGLTLYFTSNRPPSEDEDIWVATRENPDDPFEDPVLLAGVNGKWVDESPSISEDGLSLYLSNTRPGSNPDLKVSTRPSAGATISEPERLSPPVNTGANELAPAITFDCVELFFTSTREDGQRLWVARSECPIASSSM